ncbi:hypothetical protein OI18_09090 [Flavihumibacter solisilvae]|uniref:Uncharacterized protein n=2 Tax=Flavihumibacter solisilvae TaxID=1349421 RepID=A0A0C1L6B0_9BACT|nr:hypothetical protein OI18_09090 [Flavihumibacter solisilvae]
MTSQGIESFANFVIGSDRQQAIDIFRQLKGKAETNKTDMLFMTFIESHDGLPVNLEIIGCTLDQLAENCKIISREIFKLKNIDIIY